MIEYKSAEEIEVMKKSCRLSAQVLDMIESHIKAGISTEEIDRLCSEFILKHGSISACLGYRGAPPAKPYPKSICTSVNDVVCHGIPDGTLLSEGDIINVDVTTIVDGFHGDTSRTFYVGKCSRAARELVETTLESMWVGIRTVRPGAHIGDIGAAIQKFIEPRGYTIVREYGGHGIGRSFHEDPHVQHIGRHGTGPEIKPGMTFTIEPMINQGTREVELMEDDYWTVRTEDQKLSAQFEHTIAVFEDRVEVLTLSENDSTDPIVWRK